MPTYLTPGVYVEEVPSANKPIEGVSTSIAAFVGLAPGGPVNTPMRISNWTQFAKIYGDPNEPDNGPFMEGAYLAHSVYGLFQNLVSADGSLGVAISFTPIINVMIGGIGSFFGPIWGTAIFQILEELTSRFTERVELVIGTTLIAWHSFSQRRSCAQSPQGSTA